MISKADSARSKLLKMSHDSWVSFRDQQCALEFDFTRVQHQAYAKHGSMAENQKLRCELRLNDNRLTELRVIAQH